MSVHSDDGHARSMPRRRTDVRVYDFGEEAVLHDPKGGSMQLLNRTAAAVWRRCDGAATVGSIAAELVGEYEVSEATAEDHVEQLASRFARAGLLAEEA